MFGLFLDVQAFVKQVDNVALTGLCEVDFDIEELKHDSCHWTDKILVIFLVDFSHIKPDRLLTVNHDRMLARHEDGFDFGDFSKKHKMLDSEGFPSSEFIDSNDFPDGRLEFLDWSKI